jgi:hypothetical protein
MNGKHDEGTAEPKRSTENPKLSRSRSAMEGGLSARQRMDIGQEAEATVGELAEDVREKIRETAEWARREGAKAGRSQMQQLAVQAHGFANALDGAAERLAGEGHETAARYAREARNRLNDAANYVRERNFSQLYRELESLARRRLDLVLGGLFLAGLAAARFMKARRPEELDEEAAHRDERSYTRRGEEALTSTPTRSGTYKPGWEERP